MVQSTLTAARLAALVDGFDRSPAYAGLADALRELIGDGRIGYGTRLPSERDLTEALGVSRTTVTRAYARLRDTAYAEARQGSGTFTRLPGGRTRALDRALWPSDVGNGVIDLVCAAATAPPGIAALYAEAAAELPAHLGGHGYFPAGMPALQAAIAATYDARGLPTDPEQVIVTPGALAATAVIGTALAGPRERVLMEAPTYPNAVQALRSGGGRLATIALDPSGWDLDAIGSSLARHRPRLVHVMPDFHNPTGLVMSEADRAAYARLLARHDATAVVDEAHHLLHLDDDPAVVGRQPLRVVQQGRDLRRQRQQERLGRPAARLDPGAARAGRPAHAGAGRPGPRRARARAAGPHPAAHHQHGRRRAPVQRARLREQRDALAGALAERLPDWEFRMPAGGMALWLRLPSRGATALSARPSGTACCWLPDRPSPPRAGWTATSGSPTRSRRPSSWKPSTGSPTRGPWSAADGPARPLPRQAASPSSRPDAVTRPGRVANVEPQQLHRSRAS